MAFKALLNNASQAYVMSKYLADLCKQIGEKNYLASPIRLEHGTGTGFFGVGNTGSTDCVKERFRGITDHLGQRWSCWQQIQFVSESCIGITSADFVNIHRVEHTREVIDLFESFEKEYIISGKPFTAADLANWVIENSVVCLIEQVEQLKQVHYNDEKPFSKYSKSIFYNGTDISEYSLSQLKQLNLVRFAGVMKNVTDHNFTKLNTKNTKNLLEKTKKHTLPPLTIAVQYHDNEYELLDQHYQYKISKFSEPLKSNGKKNKWYNEERKILFENWKKLKNEELSMA
jgi:hypothetical protein